MMDVSPELVKGNVRKIAQCLGFDLFGVAGANMAVHAEFFRRWIVSGNQADMEWLVRNSERRVDPSVVLPGARSVIMLGMNYYPGKCDGGRGRFARYARGEDYHGILEEKLADLCDYLESLGGVQKFYVDAGPVLERDWAVSAGLGWCGKSGLLIHPQWGSWTFLASVLTTVEMPPDVPMASRCGFCRRCMDACPTGAISGERWVDARRCLSYWTIENKGAIPLEFRKLVGDRVYGCDSCLEACPWNRRASRTSETRFLSKGRVLGVPLREMLFWSEDVFAERFRKSPVKRIKRRGLFRNICVVLGNVGTEEDLPALRRLAEGEDPLVAEHARWAVAEIERRVSGQS